MLDLAIVDKLNRAGFVVAPYNTPEEVPSVKSVSGPARHVGEADKRVRDSRGGSPCGENRCGIGECREGERTQSQSAIADNNGGVVLPELDRQSGVGGRSAEE